MKPSFILKAMCKRERKKKPNKKHHFRQSESTLLTYDKTTPFLQCYIKVAETFLIDSLHRAHTVTL